MVKRCADIKALEGKDCCDSCHDGEENWGDYLPEYRDKDGNEWEVCCKAKALLEKIDKELESGN